MNAIRFKVWYCLTPLYQKLMKAELSTKQSPSSVTLYFSIIIPQAQITRIKRTIRPDAKYKREIYDF